MLSAILEIFIERIFSDIFFRGICVWVVSVNTNVFCSCCDNIFHISGVGWNIFSVNLFERTLFLLGNLF